MFRSRLNFRCDLWFLSSRFNSNHLGCYDVVIVGGGIVGTAAARAIKKQGNISCAIVEKECSLAEHQSSHNSGVIHAGIYYKPGTLRAQVCTEGMHRTYEYCDKHCIPYKKVGKLIVASNYAEELCLLDLKKRGDANGVPDLQLVNCEHICRFEPHCVGTRALHSPHTGIIDWGKFTQALAKEFRCMGGFVYTDFEVMKFNIAGESSMDTPDINKYPVTLSSAKGKCISASFVLTCAGLYSDKVAKLTGCSNEPAIIPVRGEYLVLKPEKQHLVKGNIYPVPDPRLPFLGVHFTPRMDGTIWMGPNAVLAFQREGYSYSNINMRELLDALQYKGFQRLAMKYTKFGISEFIKSVFMKLQLKELQKYIPEICPEDIMRGPTGVRAQALDPCGDFVEDFVFDSGEGRTKELVLHCRNAPSPGATSSLAIGDILASKVLAKVAY